MSETVKLSIPNIMCHHCVNTIKSETEVLPGVLSVEGDPQGKTATFELAEPGALTAVKATLAEIGYPAQG
jgi:copper chaperone CopZ